jgi:molecular chaperone DnaK
VPEAAPVVGIDLGTTNSVVAFVDRTGRPTCVTNFEGDILTPSAILIEGNLAVIGREARKAAPGSPHRFAECFKRYMGEPAYPEPVDGRRWRPEGLSALVLRRLRSDVTRQLGHASPAVITVPAYFDERRRRATQEAGALAGWQVVDLVNEPTAAAIAFAHEHGAASGRANGTARVLVYDLGGGTFDTTILEVRSGREYRTVATEGEVQLGGHDWDERLAQHLAEQFRSKTGRDPLASARGRVEFRQLARGAKHTLSMRPAASVPCLFEGCRTILEVRRETFESLTADLLRRSRLTTELVLEQARLRWADLDRVLLVGGSTRMPVVRRMLEELTGRRPDDSLSPDEAVAHGAAIYARLLRTPGAPRVINVNSHSYRVHCLDRQGKKVAVPLIPRNSPLPRSSTRVYPVQRAGTGGVRIRVCEGEADDPGLCELIGEVVVTGLPRDVAQRWEVALTVTCRQDGNLAVEAAVRSPEARDRVVQAAAATLVPRYGMRLEELTQLRALLDSLALN